MSEIGGGVKSWRRLGRRVQRVGTDRMGRELICDLSLQTEKGNVQINKTANLEYIICTKHNSSNHVSLIMLTEFTPLETGAC